MPSWRRGKWLVCRAAVSKETKFRLRGVTRGGGEGPCGKQLQLPRSCPCVQPFPRLAIPHAVPEQGLSPRGAETSTTARRARRRIFGSRQAEQLECPCWCPWPAPRRAGSPAESAPVFSPRSAPLRARQAGRGTAGAEPLLPRVRELRPLLGGSGAAALQVPRGSPARFPDGRGAGSAAHPSLPGAEAGRDASAGPPSKLAVLEAAGAGVGGPGKALPRLPALIAYTAREGRDPRVRFSHYRGGAPARSPPTPAGGRRRPGWREPSLRGGGGRPGRAACRGPGAGQRRGGGAAVTRFRCPSSWAAPRPAPPDSAIGFSQGKTKFPARRAAVSGSAAVWPPPRALSPQGHHGAERGPGEPYRAGVRVLRAGAPQGRHPGHPEGGGRAGALPRRRRRLDALWDQHGDRGVLQRLPQRGAPGFRQRAAAGCAGSAAGERGPGTAQPQAEPARQGLGWVPGGGCSQLHLPARPANISWLFRETAKISVLCNKLSGRHGMSEFNSCRSSVWSSLMQQGILTVY